MSEEVLGPIGEDELADDDIVTLMSADGEEIDFVEIAGIAHKGAFYAILQPVELLEGMSDDEALVFKVSRGEDGEDRFEIELDDVEDFAEKVMCQHYIIAYGDQRALIEDLCDILGIEVI